MSIKTVTIADPDKDGDYLIINEADFDPARHSLWKEPAAFGGVSSHSPDSMTRAQMFAFLRDRGEAAASASKDDTLRERIRAIIAAEG